MKKSLIFTIILLLQSFPSFGKWVKYENHYVGNTYIEEDTISKRGDLVYVNLLYDFLKPNPFVDNSLSNFHRIVVNCKNFTFKNIVSIYYKRSMGRGKIIKEERFRTDDKFYDLMSIVDFKNLPKKIC